MGIGESFADGAAPAPVSVFAAAAGGAVTLSEWDAKRALADFGVVARGAGEQALIGVWSGEQKVASIGVHLSRWVTTHGFALNVDTDLSFFGRIVPCGLPSVRMASISSLTGEHPGLADVASAVARHFGDVFGRDLVERRPAGF